MKEKAQKWLASLTASRLHRWMMWFSVDHQLWPSVKYRLCCSMATLPELEDVLLMFYWKMLRLGGIVSKEKRGIQQLDCGFYGAGFPHLGIKAMVKQANKLLMLYGCHTALDPSYKHPWNFSWQTWGSHFNLSKFPSNIMVHGHG
jgi:hypothetical protein